MNTRSGESGQVILVGLVMMIILLVSVFILADVHNTIRAKLKLETSLQAAALAAAEWQRESLNLIGEINLIKASDALLQPKERLPIMQMHYDRLTEMQTRVSFLGPLIAFAAAQQAAKANGINAHGDLSKLYLAQLNQDNLYYFPPGSDGYINNYKWFAPYRAMVETISMNGIAIRPNVSNAFSISASPYGLNLVDFYRNIHAHNNDISQKPDNQLPWEDNSLRSMCKKPDSYYRSVWWDIRFLSPEFIKQSEIYPLYVKMEEHQDYSDAADELKRHKLPANPLPTIPERPYLVNLSLQWYCYDLPHWDTDLYCQKYNKTKDEHLNWYNRILLQNKIKEAYQYEGPAAYAETGLRLSHLSYYLRPNSNENNSGSRNLFKTNARTGPSTIIGAARVVNADKEIDLDERPGAMAKPFGKLLDGKKPHAIRMILPVFSASTIVPTHFPRLHDFAVLHEPTLLEIFLMWLSTQADLTGTPPANTENYLLALQILEKGPEFRYYCWNPNFDADKFNNDWKDKWHEYYEKRNRDPYKYVYEEKKNPTGPGWLQEPRYYGPSRKRGIRSGKTLTADCNIHKGKTVTLVGIAWNSFYIIGHDGKVITNEDPDPIREYYGNTFSGPGGGENNFYVGDEFNAKPGVPRL